MEHVPDEVPRLKAHQGIVFRQGTFFMFLDNISKRESFMQNIQNTRRKVKRWAISFVTNQSTATPTQPAKEDENEPDTNPHAIDILSFQKIQKTLLDNYFR